jgi:hypothetical protein
MSLFCKWQHDAVEEVTESYRRNYEVQTNFNGITVFHTEDYVSSIGSGVLTAVVVNNSVSGF